MNPRGTHGRALGGDDHKTGVGQARLSARGMFYRPLAGASLRFRRAFASIEDEASLVRQQVVGSAKVARSSGRTCRLHGCP
eukprot:CAMPEP_0204114792 /NCGR_PEP_ID=MMETSP0361-20130328/4470_1 /ASSEMBLY_ACC=CAM_ASM_000343 /TAXON_ID=268821 /ORGANISM="Scrippsiella Hangoei, Strain SHTV-5" /LENGTH=80 /DNA_ID=CAMNT_0051065381 /DNA_START=151 /DNA_END=389 /DNA_ORIENTATION=-